MEKTDKISIYQEFIRMSEERVRLKLRGFLDCFLDYAEYNIKSQTDKGNKKLIKYKKKKDMFKERFLEAYNSQSTIEKIEEYVRVVKHVKLLTEENPADLILDEEKIFHEAYCLSYNLHLWKKKELKLDMAMGQMFCHKDGKIKFYDLNNYLIRESKNTDYFCFVLEAVNTQPHHKSLVVRIGFKDIKTFKECFRAVKDTVLKMERKRIREELGIIPPIGTVTQGKKVRQEDESEESQSSIDQYFKSESVNSSVRGSQDDIQASSFRSEIRPHQSDDDDRHEVQTIAQSLLQADNSEQMYSIQEKEGQNQPERKRNLDVFHHIVPDYDLSTIFDQTNFQLIQTQAQGKIYRHNEDVERYKIKINVDAPQGLIFQSLARVQNYTKWNQSIEDVIIKSILKSENVVVMYQKHRSISKIYRARDFVFMRHVFRKGEDLYMVDKSIENASYPPFLTIVRGELQIVWGILKKDKGYEIVGDVQIDNAGYLNESQNHNLTMLYLKGLMRIQEYLEQKDNEECQWDVFHLNWDISKSEKGRNSPNKRAKKESEACMNTEKAKGVFKKVKLNHSISPDRQEQHVEKGVTKIQISPEPARKKPSVQRIEIGVKTQPPKKEVATVQKEVEVVEVVESSHEINLEIKYDFDDKGMVVIPSTYLKTKYHFSPQPSKPFLYQQVIEGSAIWKGEWRFDKKQGGVIFINQQKINDQKGVIKFILSKIAKNLLSGKSVLSISLPVDIFGYETNIERFAFGLTYAPVILEKAVADPDPVDRLKLVAGFGLTNSAMYLSMEKPFNPILGETFQGWINGCPVYVEQISHHPPIAAFILFGRGYKVTGCLESKVEIHMNSGCGTTDGVYRVVMDDGSDYNFITPGGEISGISYGDRKFNLIGKYFVWSKKHRLFLDISIDPGKKGFFSKKEHPSDYMEGEIKEVSPEFLTQFQKLPFKEKEGPSKDQTVRVLSKATGTWCRNLMFDGKVYLNLDEEVGCKLEYDNNMLPSDGNWREDLAYRRKRDITRAQTEKERLENFQRADKKLREKYHKSKH